MGEPWFGVKTYGLGLSPKSPAGWISTGGYVVAMAAAPALARHLAAPHWAVPAALGAITLGFLALVFLKSDGQPWRWRWGSR